jgi:hypothetical protein
MLYELRINPSNSRLIVWVDEQIQIVWVGGDKYKAGDFSGSDVCRRIIICGAAPKNVGGNGATIHRASQKLTILVKWRDDITFPGVLFLR